MENRFGFRDLILCTLLVVLIVTVLLAMKQYDRQLNVLETINERLSQQTTDLSAIRRRLAEGVVTPSTVQGTSNGANPGTLAATANASALPDPFDRVKLAEAKADFARGDWFIDVFPAQVGKLTPLISSDVYGTIVQNHVLEWLAIQDPETLAWKPLLAKSWHVKDNTAEWQAYVDKRKKDPLTEKEVRKEPSFPIKVESGEDLTAAQGAYVKRRLSQGRLDSDIGSEPACPPAVVITFQLRKGITFSDGHPFSADDVVFSYDWIMNPRVAAPRQRAYYEKVKSVKQTGPDEVTFYFREPYFESFDLAASLDIMPRHFYEKYTPEQFNLSSGLLMGTGQYRLATPDGWKPGDPIELVRNERYWGEPGTFDRLVFRIVEDDSAQLTMFTNGELDLFGALPEQYRDMLKNKDLLNRSKHFEYYNPRGGYAYVAWNQRRGDQPTLFADKRVRQALTYLTDRPRLCEDVFLGYAAPANGPFHFLGKQADPSLEPRPFDLEKAVALLKEAGFQDRNGDGVLESPDGKPFRFKLTYPSKSPTFQRVVLFLKDTYAKAGIVLEPDPTDWPIMINKLNGRDFDAISLSWSSGFEVDIYQMFHSSQIRDNGDNFMSYSSPELDRAIDQARRTIDETKRMALWHKAHHILYEDQPYTFLFRRKSLVFIDQRIQNVQRVRAGLNYVALWVYPMEWYVPKPAQKWK